MTQDSTPKDRGPGRPRAVNEKDFDDLRVYTEVRAGGTMIIPPQDVTIRITGLADGGCRVEAIPAIRTSASRGSVKIGMRK